jgi:phosphatidate cytidylyltransferase
VLQFLWGSIFGRHQISPEISPKKTWEGFLGGLVTTVGLAYALRFLTPFNEQQSLIVGAVLAITGFTGDLVLSAFKRSLGLKDMGNVIPGHGGLLDRIDSVTLSSISYFYVIYYWFYSV